MHGGLSPELNQMEQIRRIIRPTDVPDTGAFSVRYETICIYRTNE